MIVAVRPAIEIPPDIFERLTVIHNSHRGHGWLQLCKHRLKDIHKKCYKINLPPLDAIPDRMVNEFIQQCPYCQISNRLKIPIKTHHFACASHNLFEVLHLDHMEMNTSLLSLMLFPDGRSSSPPNQQQLLKQHLLYLIILVDSVPSKSSILIKD